MYGRLALCGAAEAELHEQCNDIKISVGDDYHAVCPPNKLVLKPGGTKG